MIRQRSVAIGFVLAVCGIAAIGSMVGCRKGTSHNNAPTPLAGLSYSEPVAEYFVGVAIAPNVAGLSAGTADTFTIDPALSPGLAIDSATGDISGTPTAPSPATDYTVTAEGPGGKTAAVLTITVRSLVPVGLAYSEPSPTYIAGMAIVANSPTLASGEADQWNVAPALPTGLDIDAATGVIMGTPTAETASADYVVTATGHGASTTATLSITVMPTPPNGLDYGPPIVLCEGDVVSLVPTLAQGSADQWSVDPELPDGLAIDAATGTISGTANAATIETAYTITATNPTASTMAVLTLTVEGDACLAYVVPDAIYVPGTPISPNELVMACGSLYDFAIDPPLPDGLAFDPDTGTISGTPTTLTPRVTHTVTATGACGDYSTTIDVRIEHIFYFDIPSAACEYSVATGAGSYVQSVMVTEDGGNPGFPNNVEGFVMVIGNDSSRLHPVNVQVGATLQAMHGGYGPDLVVTNVTPYGIALAVVFNEFSAPFEYLTTETAVEFGRIEYECVGLMGVPGPLTTELEWIDELAGVPGFRTVLVQENQVPVEPIVSAGVVALEPLP